MYMSTAPKHGLYLFRNQVQDFLHLCNCNGRAQVREKKKRRKKKLRAELGNLLLPVD